MSVNQYSVTRVTSDYTASSGEHVVSENRATVTLPSPSQNAIVAVSSYDGDKFTVTTASGNIEFASSKAWSQTSTAYFVSDGNNWYQMNNRSNLLTKYPSTGLNQYIAPNFSAPWPDEIGSASMGINGGLGTTTINGNTWVQGDGTDDAGKSSADVLGNRNEFGIAFTAYAQSSNVSDFDTFFGLADSSFDDVLSIRVENDNINFNYRTTGDDLSVNGTTIADSTEHAVIINMDGTSASDVSIYVDDMTTDTASVRADQGGTYDSADWSYSGDWGFWAENVGGTNEDYINASMGTIEFNSSTYSETERKRFVERRPEVQ